MAKRPRKAKAKSDGPSNAVMYDLQLRSNCLSVASGFNNGGTGNIPNTLRGAQMIYDWVTGAQPPAETAETIT